MFRFLILALSASVLAAQTPPPSDSAHPYRNSTYSFTCKIPAGWVLRTREMNASNPADAKGEILLAAFERPPEANDSTPSSSIVVATEPASSYPGLKTAADYLEPLTAVITAKGFKPVAEPYEFTIGSTRLVRADFSKTKDKTTIYQSTLVELTRGSLVSFTFLATSEDELEQLISNLTFTSRPAR